MQYTLNEELPVITNLKLTNFKRHKELDLSFTDGLNILIGDNYKGKSSVLQGIMFALGGYSAVPGGKAVAVNDEAKNAGAELTWNMAGQVFHVKRSGSNATLSRDGEEIAKGASPVAAELAKLFGMADRRFRQLKHSAQKQTEALLTLGVAELHKIIEEISGADVVSQVIEACKVVESEAKGGLEALPEGDVPALSQQEETLRTSLLAKDRSLKDAKKQRETLQAQREAAGQALTQAQQHNAAQEAAQREIDQLSVLAAQETAAGNAAADRMAQATDAAAPLESLEIQARAAQDELNRVAGVAGAVKQAKALVGSLQARASQYGLDLEAAQDELDACPMPNGLEEAKVEVEALRDQYTAKHAEWTSLQHSAKNCACPTCQRPFEDADPQALAAKAAEAEREVQAAQGAYTNMKAALDQAVKMAADHEKAAAALVRAQEKVQENAQALTEAEASLQALGPCDEATLAELQAEVTKLQGQVTVARQARAVFDAANRECSAAQQRAQQYLDRIEALGEPEALVDTAPLAEAVQDLGRQLTEKETVVAAAEEGYRIEYGSWKEAETNLKAAKAAEEKRTQLTHRLATAGQLKKFLASNRDRYLASVWDGITSQASTFASACTDGHIARIVRKENGSFAYVEGEVERPIDAASGAQRSLMGLGVQLALDGLLPCPWQTLLLDEPAADMDTQHSLAMSSILSAEGKQLIVVTHRELDGAVAQNVIEVA
jgi:exonuclease SbcC